MIFLLDTHAFLWWITDSPELSPRASDLIANPDNELYLSAASGWEIAIKVQIGKLHMADRPDLFIPDQLSRNAVRSLPIQMSHVLHVGRLPPIHRDPFDRIIIAQSIIEKMPIITKDPDIRKYKVKTFW
ncbi:MAG TPA: type II toxin-antitoxin system VapC family toxin [Syntrophorhabdaceae bacterium]|jgi:PIN domain nuclease of toxin-antitoxin system